MFPDDLDRWDGAEAVSLAPAICYVLSISKARIPKAATMIPDPIKLQVVNTSTPLIKTSVNTTNTIVSKLPTDVTTGPQTPSKIYLKG